MKNITGLLIGLLLGGSMLLAKPLDLALGARPAGMGGAFVAIADDANAPYWNPAGMTQAAAMEASVSNQLNQEFLGVNVNLLSGLFPVKGLGVFGFNWQMTNAGLEEGDPDDAMDYREDFWREHMFSLSFGYRLWDKLWILRNTAIGANLNRYTYSTEYYHGAGVGFDASLFTLFPYGIRLGFMARSIAADIEGEMFEPEYRLGLGWTVKIKKIHRVVVASDVLAKKDIEYSDAANLDFRSMNLKVFEGVEYSLLLLKDFTPSVRFGANMTPLNDRTSTWANVTGGIGLGYKNYKVDYAVKYNTAPDYGLGMSHQIAFSIKR